MEKFTQLLEKLKGLKMTQTKSDWAENLPEDIWSEHFDNKFEIVAHNLNPDTRRWYETSIDVIKIHDRFLGIRYITNMFSERSDFGDCGVTIEFNEMKPIQVTTYQVV